jgi:hypothetical protein
MRWIPREANQTSRVAVQDPAECASFVLDGIQKAWQHTKLVL